MSKSGELTLGDVYDYHFVQETSGHGLQPQHALAHATPTLDDDPRRLLVLDLLKRLQCRPSNLFEVNLERINVPS